MSPREPGILALSFEELTRRLESRTRATAARRWLYDTRPTPASLPASVEGVTARLWTALAAERPLPAWRLAAEQVSADGTVKLALDLAGAAVETVMIPGRERSTVCVSSQSGCTRRCAFCATGRLGLRRQLTADEILLQYLVAASRAPASAPPRNVVFMGMGEPMDNLDEVLVAVERLTEAPRPALSPGRVTVSTSGVVPGIRRFLRESRAAFALSLNATTDEARERLVPHASAWPLAQVVGALREDHRLSLGRGSRGRPSLRRYMVGYVLWDGVNDGDEDADRLVGLLRGLPAHVNLIPHNAWPGSPYRASPPERVLAFQARVHGAGVRCLVRTPRGQDIAAACGQLARGATA